MRLALISSTTAGFRTISCTCTPFRPSAHAIAVPKLPPPSTATLSDVGSNVFGLSAFRSCIAGAPPRLRRRRGAITVSDATVAPTAADATNEAYGAAGGMSDLGGARGDARKAAAPHSAR